MLLKYAGTELELLTDVDVHLFDTLVLEIQNEDMYADIFRITNLYNNSNYPKDNPLYSMANKNGYDEERMLGMLSFWAYSQDLHIYLKRGDYTIFPEI